MREVRFAQRIPSDSVKSSNMSCQSKGIGRAHGLAQTELCEVRELSTKEDCSRSAEKEAETAPKRKRKKAKRAR
jgi:hypothetical protein